MSRVMEVGCAAGRTSFELSRGFESVLGVDISQAFIDKCNEIKRTGQTQYWLPGEGELGETKTAHLPPEIVSHTHTLTHSLTHSLAHSLTRSLTHSLTHTDERECGVCFGRRLQPTILPGRVWLSLLLQHPLHNQRPSQVPEKHTQVCGSWGHSSDGRELHETWRGF